jgi:Invasin, domain 3
MQFSQLYANAALLCLLLPLEGLTIAAVARSQALPIPPAQPETTMAETPDRANHSPNSISSDPPKILSNSVSQANIQPISVSPLQPPAQPNLQTQINLQTPVQTLAQTPAQTPAQANPVLQTPEKPIVTILSPTANTHLDTPASTITVQSSDGWQLDLRVNGIAVDKKLIGRTEQDARTGLVTQTWYGVGLQTGNNIITAQIIQDGRVLTAAQTQVIVRGEFSSIRMESTETRIPADGKSTATLRGQLVDAQGQRSNRDAIVTLSTTAGEFIGKDGNPDQPGFQVKAENGQFAAQLRSGLEARTVNLKAQVGGLEAFGQILFETNLRPAIATGVVNIRVGRRGTDFFGSLKDFLPPDGNYKTIVDANAAVFATGKLGDWLFTGAYNSDRALNQTCEGTTRLFRQDQFCENQYPIYGDGSKSDIVAPSIDQVYLRFEKTSKVPRAGIDYAMWGDYNTEEFSNKSQEFTASTRQLHGFKANYNIGDLQATALFANNVEGFQRDTVAPDGTSGYYFLARRFIKEGSEDIFVELEELNRPGTVLERKKLNRGPDYEIDYDRGSLLFRQPILRTDVASDGTPLVRRIVATYQYDQPGSNNKIYAGRLRYHFSREQNQESWLGATYWKEDLGARQFELYGADAYVALGSKGSLIAEYARANNSSDSLGLVSGSAYRLEAQGELMKGVQARAYYRSADSGFANNATISFVPGQTRYGAQVSAKIGNTTSLRAQYDRERNFGIAAQPIVNTFDLFTPREAPTPGSKVDNAITTLSVGVQQKLGKADLSVDWLHRDRKDNINPSVNGKSDQLRSRFTLPITDRLTFLAQNELTLSAQNDAYYPDRTLVGLDWNVMPGINVQLAQQWFTRGQFAGQSITSLALAGDYKLFPETTVNARYGIYSDGGSWQTSGTIGLKQGIRFSPGLRMDLAYERVFGSFIGQTATGAQFTQPFAPGQSAASLGVQGGDTYSIGIEYNDSPSFQTSARLERRTSSTGANTVISAGATGKLSPSLTALLRYQQASAANPGIIGLGTTANLKLGLAYRDLQSDKFNALFRYEYRKNPSSTPDSILFASGTGSDEHLFGLEAIYAPSWQWEFYGKFALRNSKTYLADDLTVSTTTTLAQLRTTYRFDYSWDVAAEARWLGQPKTGYSETGLAIEAGYYLTPNLRLSAGYAFGRVNDRDFDNDRSAGGFYAGLTFKVNELFNGFGLQKVSKPKDSGNTVAKHLTTSAGSQPDNSRNRSSPATSLHID